MNHGWRFRTRHRLVHRVRTQINATRPLHTPKIRIDGYRVKNARLEQFQKDATPALGFNGKDPSYAVAELDLQPAAWERLG